MPKSKIRKKKAKNKKSNENEMMIKKGNISDILLDFANPLIEDFSDEEQIKDAIFYASIIWNISLQEEKEREVLKKDFLEIFKDDGISVVEEAEEIMEFMLDRKERFYKNAKESIVDHEVSVDKNSININVISGIKNKNK